LAARQIKAQRADGRSDYNFAIVVNASGEVIGACDVALKVEAGHNDAEIG
jgi:hypothetical protein